ncbi:MAG TPA: hypothetical protein VHV55_01880 [Pirellulales bacterium]|nr:hypothetical protein [Pirellulales bacterium]
MRQLAHTPETNVIKTLDDWQLFMLLGKAVTSRSLMRAGPDGARQERPLSVRYRREKLYRLLRSTSDRYGRKQVLKEAHDREEIARQFLRQGEVTVTLPVLGVQTAGFTHLSPSSARVGTPTIVLIPGISNDVGCVETLAEELAFSGRIVVVISFPDAVLGRVSLAFADAVEQSATFGPHASFFKSAIKRLLPESEELELWSYSTGAPIMAEMLNDDPAFSERVKEAVLVNPAGSVSQGRVQFLLGLVKEMVSLLAHPRDLPSFVFGPPDKKPSDDSQKQKEQSEAKNRIITALLEHIVKQTDWSQMKVAPGGQITVVTSQSDDVTKCYRAFNKRTRPPNPAIRVVEIPGRHCTPLLKPAEVITAVRASL